MQYAIVEDQADGTQERITRWMSRGDVEETLEELDRERDWPGAPAIRIQPRDPVPPGYERDEY